jgi:hypothetical protein
METGQLGLVSFTGNDTEPNDDAFVRLGLGALDDAQRGRMHVAIDNLAALPGALTSVGDGIAAALAQLSTPGAAAAEHHLVLLLDGGENEEAFWADVANEVVDSGVTIHTVAQGGLAALAAGLTPPAAVPC